MKTNAFQKSQDIAFKIKRQYQWHETYKEWNDFYSNSDFAADVQIKLKKVVVLKIDILRVGNVYTIILCNKS